MWLADVPKALLELFDEVARAVVALRNPDYHLIHPDIHVRVTHLPIHDNLRELRHVRRGRLGGAAAATSAPTYCPRLPPRRATSTRSSTSSAS